MSATRLKQNTLSKRKIYAVDLFCGAGGLTHGLVKSGIDVKLGVDIDPACSYPYISNNQKVKFELKSVEELGAKDIKAGFRKNGINLLAGCAPCQTFSTYNRKADKDDDRWWLLLQFSRLVRESSPDLVTMENVPELIKQDVFNNFVQQLTEEGYFVSYKVVDCSEYGLPQHRKRLVLLASKFGSINLLEPGKFDITTLSVREAIGDLPPLTAGATHEEDSLHQSSSLSKKNLERIRASRPGGTWKDWGEHLVAECHKKGSGKGYRSVYGRMVWDDPAPTMTTQFFGFGNGRFGHPEQDRAISLREGAILQSFPREYKFVPPGEPVSIKTVGRLIGNAVPVKLGEIIGYSLRAHITEWEDDIKNRRK
ncbi:DNA (cytosine-5)-methyltransferase 1 [Paenibacillus sophorae]|uniref:Cytosine-specific methyltransferase n=1 Tax=Paenibacillus sophorae TaxID=1333845 RepID=A0A1H8TJE7_9BACL|nr:DNA cytosine methyltransferase [Paenibacillus sophorae]QWU16225.1 DNA cytosine methyltransferase [Paenibacillus sophorae]SEO90628.1 DNA (cytosine-5)-methyltransferase 1 [Paenibacillus sophorae]